MIKPCKITGKQVNLLLALFREAGIYGDQKILEWIEYECSIYKQNLEDVNTGEIDVILRKLKVKLKAR